MSNPRLPYWFYQEYLDEARRFRVNRIEAATEQEARRSHRQSCEFHWVGPHVEPSVSSLFTQGEYGQRSLVPGCRPGDQYRTTYVPVTMPDHVREKVAEFTMGAR
jgi:hypothetical protein